MITSGELLDTSIAQLQTLAAFLDEQLGDRSERAEPAVSETRACKEILLSLSVLILKVNRKFRRQESQPTEPLSTDEF
jgi:hypothetical protein